MFCKHCGTENEATAKFCKSCGRPLEDGTNTQSSQGMGNAGNVPPQYNQSQSMYTANPMGIQPKNIAVCIILSFVTCGIYGIYWFIKLTDELNALAEVEAPTSGGTAFLLTLITCNIYGFYWAYKQGEKVDYAKNKRNIPSGNTPILYLLLDIFGLAIVAYALMQNEINQLVER